MTRLTDLIREARIAWLSFWLARATDSVYAAEQRKIDLTARFNGEINSRSAGQVERMDARKGMPV